MLAFESSLQSLPRLRVQWGEHALFSDTVRSHGRILAVDLNRNCLAILICEL